jgi:hypothetical protein
MTRKSFAVKMLGLGIRATQTEPRTALETRVATLNTLIFSVARHRGTSTLPHVRHFTTR